jgi:outer membrane protein OmpA-like peptidoglycan-associated protein
MARRKRENPDGDIFSRVATDLMANLSLAFLLALGVGILMAGQLALVSQSLSMQAALAEKEVEYQQRELEETEAVRRMQKVLDGAWDRSLDEMTQPRLIPGPSITARVFDIDNKAGGVKLNADVLFETGSAELKTTPEAVAMLGAAKSALCEALEAFERRVRADAEAARVLQRPFDYVEVVFEGHADAVRSWSVSNWSLSTQRATALLTRFAVDENEAPADNLQRSCRESGGESRLDAHVVRVIAAGRGSMDATPCTDRQACGRAEDRYALIRMIIRMDKVLAAYRADRAARRTQ